MKTFTYNDMLFSVEAADGKWNIVCQRIDQRTAYVATGVFAGLGEAEVEGRARALVKAICPVGVRLVGPDVAHPMQVGDLRIIGPDVTHSSFIYWDKDSSSCPKQL